MDKRLKNLNEGWATLTEAERAAIYHSVLMTAAALQAIKDQQPKRRWWFVTDGDPAIFGERRALCLIPNPQRRAGEPCAAALPIFV